MKKPKGSSEPTDERRPALVRLDADTWRRLKIIGLDERKSIQAILEEAVIDWLKKQDRKR